MCSWPLSWKVLGASKRYPLPKRLIASGRLFAGATPVSVTKSWSWAMDSLAGSKGTTSMRAAAAAQRVRLCFIEQLGDKPNSENKDKKCLEILIDELTGNVGNRTKVDPSEKVVDHVLLLLFLFVVGVFCWGS
ncbi:hypothetical protein TYRP_009204 [Tyrophagus putrescentiae]|nr:hypothetical protein TYRP_009204 [Tyrophagus putrescentiae]